MTRAILLAILLASACVVTVLGVGACRDDPTAKAIRTTVSYSNPAASSFEKARRKLLRQVYADRDYRSRWIYGRKLNGPGRDLIETLCHAEREGLRAADYDLAGLRTELARLRHDKDLDPAAVAALDVHLTKNFLNYGADLLAGRLDPQAVDNGWYIRARRAAINSTLRSALSHNDFGDMVAPLRPRQHEYKELVQALADYRELQAKGGWGTIAEVSSLKRGDEGPWVGALRYRLQATGELRKAAGKPVYDDDVAAAVARFQERHGIPADSSVGPPTLAALNVPVATRIRQIELNLERYRWLPSDFGKRYILVNIPDYQLYAYDGGKERLTMRVIVGDEYGNATPVFADSLTYIVFRPHWDMPRRILVNEVIPKVRKNIHYLAQHGYEVVDTARNEVIAAATINWSRLNTKKIHFRIRQKSGGGNELGNVKFMFPNQFSIYLHDTPADHLFDTQKRTLSHGCVRVEDPVKLAGYVLDKQKGWGDDEIREAMEPADFTEDVKPTTVDLEHPIPVYLLYLTAFMRDGVLHFRDDPYGKDRKGMARMGRPTPADRWQCKELEELAEDGG